MTRDWQDVTDYWEREAQVRRDMEQDDWCEQCERVPTETCVACGDDEDLARTVQK